MIKEFFTKIRSKNVHPKVYSLVFKDFEKGDSILCTTFAYSLEEAIGKAKKEASGSFPDVNLHRYKIDLFNHEELESLLSEYTERDADISSVSLGDRIMKAVTDIAKEKGVSDTKRQGKSSPIIKKNPVCKKTSLMKEIIEKKDLEMLTANLDKLKPAEVKYVEDKIKEKK